MDCNHPILSQIICLFFRALITCFSSLSAITPALPSTYNSLNGISYSLQTYLYRGTPHLGIEPSAHWLTLPQSDPSELLRCAYYIWDIFQTLVNISDKMYVRMGAASVDFSWVICIGGTWDELIYLCWWTHSWWLKATPSILIIPCHFVS